VEWAATPSPSFNPSGMASNINNELLNKVLFESIGRPMAADESPASPLQVELSLTTLFNFLEIPIARIKN